MSSLSDPDGTSLPDTALFTSFLQPALDRCAFISAWLRAHEVPHSIVEMAGKRHIVVTYRGDAYDPRFRMKALVAHYDRAPGTPGANDNSAACFQLMLFAERLATGADRTIPACHNIRILFTDGEEAAGSAGIAGQGAYALGNGLRALNMTDADVYVLDGCGRGDTLVLSTSGLPPEPAKRQNRETRGGTRIRRELEKSLEALHRRAVHLARTAAAESWVTLRTPYSDNAGFIAAGIPAQIVTILPRAEAETLMRALSGPGRDGISRSDIEETITANRQQIPGSPVERVIPETWRLMHTGDDVASTLTAAAFTRIARFLDAVARSRESAI